MIDRLKTWWQQTTGEEDTPFDGDSLAFVSSLVFHMFLLMALGLMPLLLHEPQLSLTISAPLDEVTEEELKLPEEFTFDDQPNSDEIGANSINGEMMALSAAEIVTDEIVDVVSPMEVNADLAPVEANLAVEASTGLTFSNVPVKGQAGQGETGATGAVDRITHEILRSLEDRKTLVVWLFDQSASLTRQRAEINDRFDRIYRELGVIEAQGNEAFAKHDDKPLLTSVYTFGESVTLKTEEPTDDLALIKSSVEQVEIDRTGTEKVFEAVYKAADHYKDFRTTSGNGPERNVMLVVFTDEVGDDQEGLTATINVCRKYAMPVYVVGVPAPFGRRETMVKWVDPDPDYDQTPQWGRVNQGPESLLPERVKLEFMGEERNDTAPIDSGFGPFSLTRLCYETGGIYFAVHPNRNVSRAVNRNETAVFSAHIEQFFDPNVMRRYQPDYVTEEEYKRRVKANGARAALLNAAMLSWASQMKSPKLKFEKRDEASFSAALSEAQKGAAKLGPKLMMMYSKLAEGEKDRLKEPSPRWQAGYDLAMGRVTAAMVRTNGYNLALAKGKTGLKYTKEKSNTWVLTPSDTVSGGSLVEKAAEKARMYLQRVIDEHPKTPWAHLAKRELDVPLGWEWVEDYTAPPPPRQMGAGGGNNNAPGVDDKAKKLKRKGPPKRAIKL